MPLYDWVCRRGHEFEAVVPMADRDKPIPCEVEIDILNLGAIDDDNNTKIEAIANSDDKTIEKMIERKACGVPAKRVEISHSHPGTLLDHGYGANAALAKKLGDDYVGQTSTRGISKGRSS